MFHLFFVRFLLLRMLKYYHLILVYYKYFFKIDTDSYGEFLAVKPIEMNTEKIYNFDMENLEKRIRNAIKKI